MSLPRMRTAEGILRELRTDDPCTAVTLHFIRGVIAAEVIPVVSSGRRKLIDYDRFLAFLGEGGGVGEEEAERGKIRRIQG